MKSPTPLRLVASEPPRPRVPRLDLTPTGRLPHVVAAHVPDCKQPDGSDL